MVPMSQPPSAPTDTFVLPVKEFLTITTCPDGWLHYDLYLFRDEKTVYYVGQSDLAFARIWRHIQDGFKGRSLVGKYLRVNWPKSMNFSICLMSSNSPMFANVNHSIDEAERFLIWKYAPCFNEMLNHKPTAIPDGYRHPDENVPYPRHVGRMMREAEAAVDRERQRNYRKAEW